MYNVIKLQSPFERLKQYNSSPEVNLYKAVIIQAITDATNLSDMKANSRQMQEAQDWLFNDSESLNTVCEAAGMTTYYVRTLAKKLIMFHSKMYKNNKITNKSI